MLDSGPISRVTRIIPYPPSFRSRAARSIDPAIGASTWALGSQRCRPYSGAFTMNARRRASPVITPVHELDTAGCVSSRVGRCRVPIFTYRCMIAISRGSELIRV